jgi:hypothetical protein
VTLIAPSELLKAYEKWEQQEAAKATPAPAQPAPASRFRYTPRTKAQWERRARQNYRGLGPATRTAKPITPAVTVAEDAATDEPKVKVSGKTKCVCGHARTVHCAGNPMLHTPEGSGGGYFCLFEHCEGQKFVEGKMVACDCAAFRVAETDTPKLKHPKADDFTACANCGHWRSHHCKARKPSKARKPKKPDKWQGFEVNGEPFVCKHVPSDPALPFHCTSTSCAHSADGVHFCGCERYVNPLAKPRVKAAKPRKPRTPRTVTAFMTGVGTPAEMEQATGEQP